MEPHSEFAVIVIGHWTPICGRTCPAQQGPAVIWSAAPESRVLRELASRVRPAWLLAGEIADDGDDLLMHAVAAVRGVLPGLRIAVLGPPDDSEHCERWVRRGSMLYLDPASSPERVISIMRAAMEWDIVATDGALLRSTLAHRAELQDSLLAMGGLSPAELRVLHLIQRGRRNTDIVDELHLMRLIP